MSGEPVSTGTKAKVQVAHTAIKGIVFRPTGDSADQVEEDTEKDEEVTVEANEEVEMIAHLEHFTKPPKTAKFEIFADHPPETGGTPAKTVTAKGTEQDMTGTWTYDPKAQKTLKGVAWIRATADSATLVAHVRLADAGISKLQWLHDATKKPATLVRPGESVTVSCVYSSKGDGDTPKIEVFAGKDVHWAEGHPAEGASPLATLDVTDDAAKKTLTASWTVQQPDSAKDAPSPEPMPHVFFQVEIGDRHVLSPPLSVLPDLKISFEPGDPGLLMAPLFRPEELPLEGEHEDKEIGLDPDPDSKHVPTRVLGIKQRLQALGYYYEVIAKDSADKQTRVFRKCVRWYWENVDPKKSPPTKPWDGDSKDPEAGPKAIDTDADDFTDWCKRLEQAVRDQLLVAEKGDLDLSKDTRLVFPGDLHFTKQEHLADAKPVDYTFSLTKAPYDRHVGGPSDAPPSVPQDFRNKAEERLYKQNPALGKVPLVAKLQMKRTDGSYVDGPADGLRVLFQLASVGDQPSYMDDLELRDKTRIYVFHKTLSPAEIKDQPSPAGPKGYLKGVHEGFQEKKPAADTDPTWWNAPSKLGGKRGSKVQGNVFPLGDAHALGVAMPHAFPWSAEDAIGHPDHAAPHHGTVSVPVEHGKAVVVFAPSRRGGDAYKVRAFVDSPVPPAPKQDPDVVADQTTGTLTVWRRVRVTRYFQKKIPPSWTADQVSEAGGALETIDWTNVAKIYKKAFIILEPPAKPEPVEITLALRDKATRGVVGLLKKICTGARPDYHEVFYRLLGKKIAAPHFDPDQVFRLGKDSPYLLEWNTPRDHDAAAGDGFARAGDWPWNGYLQTVTLLSLELIQLFPLFLDDAFDPGDPDGYEAVPFPGVTCVQALLGDNVTLKDNPDFVTGLPIKKLDLDRELPLQEGDKVSVQRYRSRDVSDARAKKPWNEDPDETPNLAPGDVKPWRQVDFVFGTHGRTYRDLATFLGQPAQLGALSHEAGKPDVDFQVEVDLPRPAGKLLFVYRLKDTWYSPWVQDGFTVTLAVTKADGSAGDSPFTVDWLQQNLPSPIGGRELTTSGMAFKTRSFGVFYGSDAYHNRGLYGAQPGGRGYYVPGRLLTGYDLDTNAAHELGHTLFLRHHWTARADARQADHDYNDVCLMSYYTSYVSVGGAVDTKVEEKDVLAGNNRDVGRADLCGRCLLKLRGWSMAFAPNAKPYPAKVTPQVIDEQNPVASSSNLRDW